MKRFFIHSFVALLFAVVVTVGVFIYIQYEIKRSQSAANGSGETKAAVVDSGQMKASE